MEYVADYRPSPICTSLPLHNGQIHMQRMEQDSTDLGEKVVREKEYRSAMADMEKFTDHSSHLHLLHSNSVESAKAAERTIGTRPVGCTVYS